LFWIAGLCYAIPVAIYGINFIDFEISKETGKWGEFGDFLGGVINPTIGLITIWFLAANLNQADKLHSNQMSHAEKISDFEICIALISYYESNGRELVTWASKKKEVFEITLQNRLDTLGDSPEDDEILSEIRAAEQKNSNEVNETQEKAQRFFDLSDELKDILGRQHSLLKQKYSK
jgi:hypothetical protein